MGFSDEQIRDMLELKEELTEKIIKYKEQIEKLEKNKIGRASCRERV